MPPGSFGPGSSGFQFDRSVSEQHEELIRIAFSKFKPSIKKVQPPSDPSRLTRRDLDKLYHMTMVEFASSLQQQPNDAPPASEPRAFDVVDMKVSTPQQRIARVVCVPITKPHKMFVWLDSEGYFWPVEATELVQRLASLSGPVRILQALKSMPTVLMQQAMGREGIFEVGKGDLKQLSKLKHFNLADNLNSSQKLAVAATVSPRFTRGFFVVQGPPGTGKTATAVAMIKACQLLKPKKTILVAAPSNAAAANVALKLYTSSDLHISKLLVYGQNCEPSVRFLNPIHRWWKFRDMKRKYRNRKEGDTLTKKLVEEMAKWLHLDPSDCALSEIRNLCPFFDLDTKRSRICYDKVVKSVDVVVCTLSSLGSAVLEKNLRGTVDTIFLDEAGQCSEAEFYVAAAFPGLSRIVTIGDPAQLPATVKNQKCEKAGYGESWIGHVFKLHRSKVHLLNTQYRMDPEVLAFPNQQFYHGRIQSGASVLVNTPLVQRPYLFIDTEGRGREESSGGSFQNRYEAATVLSILQHDADILKIRAETVDPRTIVITPYRAQAKLLKKRLEGMSELGRVNVSTVDSFQGQEGEIVVVSTVRTQQVGFVDNDQRLNVALTRAKRVLRLVGDAPFFKQLQENSTL